MPPGKNRFYILTLGCPKNEVDSDLLASLLIHNGWKKVAKPLQADIVVVNTCSFIQAAVEEAVEVILDLHDLREGGRRRLVVAGCLVARYGKSSLSSLLPEVNLFIDIPEYALLPQLLAERPEGTGEREARDPERAYSSTLGKGYVYIKIAEGCRRKCTFCTIPSIRGQLSSRRWEEVVEEGRYFVGKGAKELVLIAQDTTSYGVDLYGRPSLPLLLKRISELTGDFRVRVMYLHPHGVEEELLEAVGDPKICNYLEIPMQHVDLKILKAMGRAGGYSEYRNLLSGVRDYLGEVALRTSFMVGFPGEDDHSFTMLRDFVIETRFDWLGLFRYSQEDETPASSLAGGISRAEGEYRLKELAILQEEIMRERALGFIASEFTVLVEGESTEAPGYWEARSWREAPEIDGVVFIPHNSRLRPGTFCEVEITDSEGIDLIGTLKGLENGEEKGQGRGHLEPSQRPDGTAHLPGAGYSPFTFKRKPL